MPSDNDSFSEFIQRIIFGLCNIRFLEIISEKKKKFDKNIAC